MEPLDNPGLDPIQTNLACLRQCFPQAFTEGKVDFEVLKQLLGGAVDESPEKYGLSWNGKRKARMEALKTGTGTLRPAPEDSVEWDSTRNILIEGDNLEVLKLLRNSYANQVKLIYIDPPYNTGGDFVYPDDYQDNLSSYLEKQGEHGSSANPETSGRYHTDWLNMLFPRLTIARELLHQDGLLVVHMDEHEQANTEKLITEVFGEGCFLGMAVWDKRNPKGDSTGLSYQHESLFFAAKDPARIAALGGLTRRKRNAEAILAKAKALYKRIGKQELPQDLKALAKKYSMAAECTDHHVRHIDLEQVRKEFSDWIKAQDFSGGEAAYSLIDDEGRVYQSVSMGWPNKKQAPPEYFIPLKHPITGRDCEVPTRGWRNPPATMKRLFDAGEILFGSDHTTQPRRKYLLENNMEESIPSVIPFGGSDDALLSDLGIPFEHPKPVELSRAIISTMKDTEGIVVDFFAGSGTTGHAVMAQNAADGCQRRYILVQLPEVLDPAKKEQKVAAAFCDELGKPLNIAELTKERLRRAAKKVKAEHPAYEGDLGFRVFKLDSSNLKAWDPDTQNVQQSLLDAVEHIKADRSTNDVLYELLLKLGLDLAVPMQQKTIAGKLVHAIGGGVLLVCLEGGITPAVAEPLAMGIAAWHAELKPEGREPTVIFADSAFDGDVAKSNITAILEQLGLKHVRSV
jgi:adenine-specific DNA-methyltransferase